MTTIPVEVGVVDVVVFRQVERGWQVLALQRAADVRNPLTWETVHGKVEEGESLPVAAARELKEETGLAATLLLSIAMHPFYLVPAGTVQLTAVFAAVVDATAKIALSAEHTKHAWLTISQARRRLVWPQDKRSLADAYVLLRTPAVHDVLRVL